VKDADQLIAGALRDIAAEAGLPGPVADAAWRAGRRRRLTVLAASAVSIAAAIALALAVVLPLTAAPGPASPPPPSPLTAAPPSPLVSITLSPATPAGTDVLARAARLLGLRAAHLRLPGTQARVAGPDVVLTGPATDEAQLKAIAVDGVLNVRQVLLYQPYGGTASAPATYGDASLVNHRTLALFRKLACKPGESDTAWKAQVGYTRSSDWDNPDAQIVSCDSSGGKYALDVAKVLGEAVTNATAELSTTNNQWEVLLTFDSAGTSAFGALTTSLYDNYYSGAQAGNEDDVVLDQVANVLDGDVVSAPEVAGPIPGGMVQITGNFTRAQAGELAADVHSGALPADFRISAVSTSTPSASSQAAAG
jgi:preprotein translocase subunit SecD